MAGWRGPRRTRAHARARSHAPTVGTTAILTLATEINSAGGQAGRQAGRQARRGEGITVTTTITIIGIAVVAGGQSATMEDNADAGVSAVVQSFASLSQSVR